VTKAILSKAILYTVYVQIVLYDIKYSIKKSISFEELHKKYNENQDGCSRKLVDNKGFKI